jgi:hypothetical protein
LNIIGNPNDTTGTCGTLKGKVYDKFNEPLADRTLQIDFNFSTGPDGKYSTRVFARPRNMEWIKYLVSKQTEAATIEPIQYVMEPDSLVKRDIYLKDTLAVGIIEAHSDKDNPVNLYPNPLSSSTALHFEIDLPIKASNCQIQFYGLNGQLIDSKEIYKRAGTIDFIGNDERSVYLVKILLNDRVVAIKKLLILDR